MAKLFVASSEFPHLHTIGNLPFSPHTAIFIGIAFTGQSSTSISFHSAFISVNIHNFFVAGHKSITPSLHDKITGSFQISLSSFASGLDIYLNVSSFIHTKPQPVSSISDEKNTISFSPCAIMFFAAAGLYLNDLSINLVSSNLKLLIIFNFMLICL